MTATPLRGYIALTSTLVISFILMTFAVLAGESGFRALMNTLNLENRQTAAHAARSCASIALLLIAQDSSYDSREGNGEVQLTEDLKCVIEEVHEENGNFLVETSSMVGTSVSRVQIEGVISPSSTISITKWVSF